MQNVISLIFVALIVYLMFSRKGGMGCCGGHGGHKPEQDQNVNVDRSSYGDGGDVIDLHKDGISTKGVPYHVRQTYKDRAL